MKELSITYIGSNMQAMVQVNPKKMYVFNKTNNFTCVADTFEHFYIIIRSRKDFVLTSDKEWLKKGIAYRTPLRTVSQLTTNLETAQISHSEEQKKLFAMGITELTKLKVSEFYAIETQRYMKEWIQIPLDIEDQVRQMAKDYVSKIKYKGIEAPVVSDEPELESPIIEENKPEETQEEVKTVIEPPKKVKGNKNKPILTVEQPLDKPLEEDIMAL